MNNDKINDLYLSWRRSGRILDAARAFLYTPNIWWLVAPFFGERKAMRVLRFWRRLTKCR